MKQTAKEKLIIFAVSIVFFALGVYAIYMEQCSVRTIILAIALTGLLAVALRQSVRLRKKGDN